MLILSLNLGWNDSCHGHGKNSRVDSQEKDDPLVSVRSILDIPLLGPSVPGMSSTHRSRNLIMRQWSQSLFLVNETAAFNSIVEHFLNDGFLDRQLLFLDIALYLLTGDPIIEVYINLVTQVTNAVHGHFKRLISLVQVLLGARKIARVSQVFHAHYSKLLLGLYRILVNE